jgi:hypothetical protein
VALQVGEVWVAQDGVRLFVAGEDEDIRFTLPIATEPPWLLHAELHRYRDVRAHLD